MLKVVMLGVHFETHIFLVKVKEFLTCRHNGIRTKPFTYIQQTFQGEEDTYEANLLQSTQKSYL